MSTTSIMLSLPWSLTSDVTESAVEVLRTLVANLINVGQMVLSLPVHPINTGTMEVAIGEADVGHGLPASAQLHQGFQQHQNESMRPKGLFL